LLLHRSIRLWSFDGSPLSVLNGHDSFVYSLALLPNGDLASSGEDRTVRIWKGEAFLYNASAVILTRTVADNGEAEQTITLPAISGNLLFHYPSLVTFDR
jgi:phospholipase A-2-activating protein